MVTHHLAEVVEESAEFKEAEVDSTAKSFWEEIHKYDISVGKRYT